MQNAEMKNEKLRYSAVICILHFAFCIGMLLAVACERSDRERADEVARIRAIVESRTQPSYVEAGRDGGRLWQLTRRFYAQRRFVPAWTDRGRPRRAMDEAIAVLGDAGREGLDPAMYEASALQQARSEATRQGLAASGFPLPRAAELDVWLTYECLTYGEHLLSGRVNPREVDAQWHAVPRKADLLAVLGQAVQTKGVRATMESLVPRHADYKALRDALAKYRAIQVSGGWRQVPTTPVVRKGARHAAVATLRERLAATGELSSRSAKDPTQFDDSVEKALLAFEHHHGLKPDGVLDAETAAALNVPVESRIRQIELNMERWRWTPESLGDRHIRVNIPQYALEAREGDDVRLAMRVIVGKADSPTPIFSDEMTHVIFSPYWNIPPGIVREETVPTLQQDPSYLARHGIEVVRGAAVVDPASIDWASDEAIRGLSLRQRPGPGNALGLVKFTFPNQFNVYLHDTPADALFARVERRFSHGCVRLERPVDLARYVLRDQSAWDSDRIDQAMHSGHERHVRLTMPIPVHLQYWTAWVDAPGGVHFREDIYGYDRKQELLRGPAKAPGRMQAAAP